MSRGARMARALPIGTDAPSLDAAYLLQAASLPTQPDAVFGPATDRGYTLVGLSRPADELFEGISWSTPRVRVQTREQLRGAHLSHAEMAPLPDIEEPDDRRHRPGVWAT